MIRGRPKLCKRRAQKKCRRCHSDSSLYLSLFLSTRIQKKSFLKSPHPLRMEAQKDAFRKVEPDQFNEFSNFVVGECQRTFNNTPSVFVGYRPPK